MAYSNFPVGYQPAQMYYPPQYGQMSQMQGQQMTAPQAQPVQQNHSSIIWVQGEAGAKSYLVAPNTTVQLWDSENQVIYLKSADASGMPSMKILDYKIRDSVQPAMQSQVVNPQVTPKYVTRDELNAFENKIREQIASMTVARRSSTKKEDKQDE